MWRIVAPFCKSLTTRTKINFFSLHFEGCRRHIDGPDFGSRRSDLLWSTTVGPAQREHNRTEQKAQPAQSRRHQNGARVLHLRRQNADQRNQAQAHRHAEDRHCRKGWSRHFHYFILSIMWISFCLHGKVSLMWFILNQVKSQSVFNFV